jgi:hypothetical protein
MKRTVVIASEAKQSRPGPIPVIPDCHGAARLAMAGAEAPPFADDRKGNRSVKEMTDVLIFALESLAMIFGNGMKRMAGGGERAKRILPSALHPSNETRRGGPCWLFLRPER